MPFANVSLRPRFGIVKTPKTLAKYACNGQTHSWSKKLINNNQKTQPSYHFFFAGFCRAASTDRDAFKCFYRRILQTRTCQTATPRPSKTATATDKNLAKPVPPRKCNFLDIPGMYRYVLVYIYIYQPGQRPPHDPRPWMMGHSGALT